MCLVGGALFFVIFFPRKGLYDLDKISRLLTESVCGGEVSSTRIMWDCSVQELPGTTTSCMYHVQVPGALGE